MPTYRYQCPQCDYRCSRREQEADKDRGPLCPRCEEDGPIGYGVVMMDRIEQPLGRKT